MKLHRPALALLATLLLPAAAAAAGIDYLGQQHLPAGQRFAGTPVGGFSGLDRDPASGRYLALSDDRSALAPARFYELTLDLAQFRRSASPGHAGVALQAVTVLQAPGGGSYALDTLDPEALRIHPLSGTLVWASEGERASGQLQPPAVREMARDGSHLRDFAVPAHYAPAGDLLAGTGIRRNLAFESLAFGSDGRTLYTATENALLQDGPAAGVGQGSPARLLAFDAASGLPVAEYLLPVAPVALPPALPGGPAGNGLAELLAWGEGRFIALERSFALGAATPGLGPAGQPTGISIRLYEIDLRGATDVSGLASLAGARVTPVAKTLLLDLSTLRNDDGSALALDNVEGMAWGPDLAGRRTLLLVSDDNFQAQQVTQFIALALPAPVPEPAAAALLLAGLLGLALRQRSSPSR